MESKVVITLLLAAQLVVLPLTIDGFRAEYYDLEWTFRVKVDEPLKPFERIGITGDTDLLGEWSVDGAVILNATDLATTWAGTVRFAANTTVNYRYFIGAVDANGGVQVREWETHLDGRSIELDDESGGIVDRFGYVNGVKEVKRGWLNSGYVLQIKLFRNPIKVNGLGGGRKIFAKVTPVDYDWSDKDNLLVPIVPSARANVEYVRMQYGNSVIRDQPEYGVPYNSDDIVVFHITLSDLKKTAYLFTIYIQEETNPELIRTLGSQYLYPETISASSGDTELVLISPNWLTSVGTIRLGYLLIQPLPTPALNFKTSFVHFWRQNWTALDIGHRGLGRSMRYSSGGAPIIENTVASMKESGNVGTDMVEFDVQLTSDLQPVIYHDFFVYVSTDPNTKPTSIVGLTKVLIKDITYEQLKALKTYQVVGLKVIEYPAHNSEPREDYRLYPLFEDFLTKVDHSVGFDIEIKWPQVRSIGGSESNQTIDKNLFIDRILDVMLRTGCGRLSFFSSFDADICTLLRFKQNMYPVTFLGPTINNYYADPRSNNLKQLINNAQAFDLGIVPHSSFFVKDLSAVKLATDLDVKIFIWGDDSSDTEMVNFFKSAAPTGVIYDRIDLWIPKGKENAFGQETEFFQKQCTLRNDTRISVTRV